jgi:formylglycine-generating enzyme required for sulfatase activity
MKPTIQCALLLLCSALSFSAVSAPRDTTAIVLVKGGSFETVLPPGPSTKSVAVASFRIDVTPVSNAQFAAFINRHPEWRRDKVARLFADEQYLAHWPSATAPGEKIARQPAVKVSWFAAEAYCEERGMRLPRWHEWEFAAAASEHSADARSDEAWRQKILDWYSKSARGTLPDVASTPANFYGIRDLHGVVWEWVDDLSALLVSGDNRQQSDPGQLEFCGPGALTMEQKENYATLMRIAMLSSMQASYTSGSMGFRCASDVRTK